MANKKVIVPAIGIGAVALVSILAYKAIESFNTIGDPFDFSEGEDEDF